MAAGGPAPGRGMHREGRAGRRRVQLADLVGKVHLLTGKPLAHAAQR